MSYLIIDFIFKLYLIFSKYKLSSLFCALIFYPFFLNKNSLYKYLTFDYVFPNFKKKLYAQLLKTSIFLKQESCGKIAYKFLIPSSNQRFWLSSPFKKYIKFNNSSLQLNIFNNFSFILSENFLQNIKSF